MVLYQCYMSFSPIFRLLCIGYTVWQWYFICFYMFWLFLYGFSPQIIYYCWGFLTIFWHVFDFLKYGYIWSSTSIKWVSPHYYGFIYSFSPILLLALNMVVFYIIFSVCFILTLCIFYILYGFSPCIRVFHSRFTIVYQLVLAVFFYQFLPPVLLHYHHEVTIDLLSHKSM